MDKFKIANIVGARPNLMKIAPILREMKKRSYVIEPFLIHTGQHYDQKLSDIFFRQLEIPIPDFYLGVGSGSHSFQTSQIMLRLEAIFQEKRPDLVLVVGDVNSTMAAALVAAKMHIPLAHVEAGLRSFDRSMPEEINRVVTDSIAQYLFITEESGVNNLRREGVESFISGGNPLKVISRVISDEVKALCGNNTLIRLGAFVGNVMIDTLLAIKDNAEQEAKISLPDWDYALVTLHRPSNVDDPRTLRQIFLTLNELSSEIQILFPCHPRTYHRIQEFKFNTFFKSVEGNLSSMSLYSSIALMAPLGYLEFLKLMAHAKLVLTDSGGIQEETTILGIPCLTLRENTERPVTVTEGTNTLVGTEPEIIMREVYSTLNGRAKSGRPPVLWDGKAGERIVKILELLGK